MPGLSKVALKEFPSCLNLTIAGGSLESPVGLAKILNLPTNLPALSLSLSPIGTLIKLGEEVKLGDDATTVACEDAVSLLSIKLSGTVTSKINSAEPCFGPKPAVLQLISKAWLVFVVWQSLTFVLIF